jgi:glycosyltransferase involved in cell wall biosynthesis
MSSVCRLSARTAARFRPVSSRNGPSILLVAQYSPPSFVVAARRVAGLTKYLARLGYRVTVLTSRFSGDGPIEGAEAVIRTSDLLASSLNWRQRRDRSAAGTAALASPPSRVESLVVPDLSVASWVPFALRAAHGLRPDCVITTSPPQSGHLAGLRLARRGIPWIAELRDGWRFDPPRGDWPLKAQRAFDSRLERSILRRADALVAVTRPIAEDLERRLGRNVELITNGFDPEDAAEDNAEGSPLLDLARFSIVHTGSMGFTGASVRHLVDGLRLLRGEAPEVAGGLEIVFAGLLSTDEAKLLAGPGLDGIVRCIGSLERQDVLRLQRAADALLVVTEGAKRPSVATGKLFEYLAAGRPILVLGSETAAAEIVRETRAGFSTSATDPRQIADAIARLTDAPESRRDHNALEAYAYPQIAARYHELIEQTVGQRRPSTGDSAAAT